MIDFHSLKLRDVQKKLWSEELQSLCNHVFLSQIIGIDWDDSSTGRSRGCSNAQKLKQEPKLSFAER